MGDEASLEHLPRGILARRRRLGEGRKPTGAERHHHRVARRQLINLPAAPRALECLSDQRAQTRDRGLKCLVEGSSILWSGA